MVDKKGWEEFRSTGLLMIINQFLHVFGWAIVYEFDDNGDFDKAYPARVKFRGFDNNSVSENYKKITEYMANNSEELKKEIDNG